MAKSVVTNAGPIERIAAVADAAMPFVVPSDRLFGADSVKKMKAQPAQFDAKSESIQCAMGHIFP